jgi:hypothetical protein
MRIAHRRKPILPSHTTFSLNPRTGDARGRQEQSRRRGQPAASDSTRSRAAASAPGEHQGARHASNLAYTWDMGDSWQYQVEVDDVLEPQASTLLVSQPEVLPPLSFLRASASLPGSLTHRPVHHHTPSEFDVGWCLRYDFYRKVIRSAIESRRPCCAEGAGWHPKTVDEAVRKCLWRWWADAGLFALEGNFLVVRGAPEDGIDHPARG